MAGNVDVCLITPGQVGSNPRIVKEARALHDAGLRVVVIATRVLDSVEMRDQAILRDAPYRIERIDLRGKLKWRLRRIGQIAAGVLEASCGIDSPSARAFSPFAPALVAAALRVRADLYIAHYPPALPAAVAAARLHGARYAYDAEDFHLGDGSDDTSRDSQRLRLRALEASALRQCGYVTAASPGIADAYAETYRIARPQVVLNAFPLAQAAPGPTARGSAEPGPSVYWFSQVVGPNRGLECAVQAIGRALARPHLYLRGDVADGFAQKLHALAADAGAADRVHFLPSEAPDQMEKLAAAYDVGLCSEPGHTRNNDLALSNKLFSYLIAGIPPLMSNTIGQRDFAKTCGLDELIYPVEDADALAQLFDRLLGDPAQLAQARARSWRLSRERYNWEMERGGFVEAVTRALQPGDAASPASDPLALESASAASQ